MKRIIVKLLISVSIGLIVGQSAAIINAETQYFILTETLEKREVTEDIYESFHENLRLEPIVENNMNSFYSFGLITSSLISIVLLGYELKKQRSD